jgi:hypothetical protein
MFKHPSCLYCFMILFLSGPPLFAQWTTQEIHLNEGWNAVFLELEPYPPETAVQLANLPVKRVWTHNSTFFPEKVLRPPSEILIEEPDWQLYQPEGTPGAFATSLHTLQAGRAYLINVSEEVIWTLRGKPLFRKINWRPDSYNLVGFPVDASSPPTFGKWFESSPAHQPLDIWVFQADGTWEQIANPAATGIRPGEAYWVYAQGKSNFEAPLRIELPIPETLHYPAGIIDQKIQIQHRGKGERIVTIEMLASESVPPAFQDSLGRELSPQAGPVVLTYYKSMESGQWTHQYVDLPAILEFPDGNTRSQVVEVAIARARMNLPPTDNALYQSIMVIKDNQGFRQLIPVTAEPRNRQMSPNTKSRLKTLGLQPEDVPGDVGLWSGIVTVNKVSEPAFNFTDPEIRTGERLPNTGHEALTESPHEFKFPLIVHIDETNTARLLNEVTLLFRQPIKKQDPNDPTIEIIVEPGTAVLMTADAPQELIDEIGGRLVGDTLRDGRSFARRISTPMFSLHDEDGNPESPVMQKTGSVFEADSLLDINLLLDDDDPLNPFHHQYHPMHRYYTEEDEVTDLQRYNIRRNITLKFLGDEEAPDGLVQAGIGDDQVCGIYRESLIRLRRDPIFVEGYFRLYRISQIPVLNNGMGFSE